MADSKIFKLVDGVTIDMVGRAVECFLRDKKALTYRRYKFTRRIFCASKRTRKQILEETCWYEYGNTSSNHSCW